MLKWLRKYNKIILVVGGSLLMIAFLLPTTLNRIGREQANKTVARMDGRKVSAMTIALAQQEINVVENALLDMKLSEAFGIRDAAHWLMLEREATAAGFVGGASHADAIAQDLAPAIAESQMGRLPRDMQTPELREQIRANALEALRARHADLASKLGPRFDEAMAKFAGVVLLRQAYMNAVRVSEPEARVLGHELIDRADVDIAVIQADVLSSSVAEPSEDALKAHFEAYKAVAPGAGDLGFGYLLPAAVKIEWITIDRSAISRLVTPDPIEVNKRWKNSRDKYPGEFAAEKIKVEDELRAEMVLQAIRDADQVIRAEIATEQKQLPADGRWKKVPENWRASAKSLEAIAAAAKEKLAARSIDYTPRVGSQPEFLSGPTLRSIPGLGEALIPIGARKVAIHQMLPEVREIGGADARGPQVGVLTGPAIDPMGNYHYFRLFGARPEGPPASLDEVRAQVVRHVKDLMAYEQAAARASELLEKARTGGLAAITAEYPSAVPTPGFVTKMRAFVQPPTLDQPELRDAVTALMARLDPTKPVADAPADARFAVVPVKKALCVAAIEIKGLTVLTKEDFESDMSQIASFAQRRTDLPPIDDPFTWERMKERHSWVLVDKSDGDEAADEPQDEAAQP